jgi:tRNA threonylcarbamoyladenosine biosynthesis protein TsaB
MSYILHLETSTKQCSVALSKEGVCISKKKFLDENFSHSEKLHLFIQDVINLAGIVISDLDAIAISKGPGSYTGLRIGVAAAKGLCFALDLPLISINTLTLMVQPFLDQKDFDFFIPMLDARRMEVYTAIFNKNKKIQLQTTALVLTEDSFMSQVRNSNCLIIGNGANKFQALSPKIKAHFREEIDYPSAENMILLAWEKFNNKHFESLADFEPYYLKDFQTIPPRKN